MAHKNENITLTITLKISANPYTGANRTLSKCADMVCKIWNPVVPRWTRIENVGITSTPHIAHITNHGTQRAVSSKPQNHEMQDAQIGTMIKEKNLAIKSMHLVQHLDIFLNSFGCVFRKLF